MVGVVGRLADVSRVFGFPNPVNQTAARVVAAQVVVLCLLVLATQWMWLTILLVYGFVARVVAGPKFSVFGQFATRVVAPRMRVDLVPGPPKRFAQGMGAGISAAALAAYYVFGSQPVALGLVAIVAVAATLESVFGFCTGCAVFGLLMRRGVIPPSVCAACNEVSRRPAVDVAR
jgi:hydrogenase-4 membrane subunit HyfE